MSYYAKLMSRSKRVTWELSVRITPFCSHPKVTHSSSARERFIHYYAQHGARLNRNQSVFRANTQRRYPLLFLLFSLLLFFIPSTYIRKLDEMYVDDAINEGPWNKFWDNLTEEWKKTTIPVSKY